MFCGIGPIPNRENHLVLSPSKLAKFIECPSIYEWEYIKGNRETTPAMEQGTMIHEYLLEPEVFASKYAFTPDLPDYSANDLKAICKEKGLKVSGTKAELMSSIKAVDESFDCLDLWTQANSHRQIVSPKQKLMLETLSERLKNSNLYSKVIGPAQKEQLMYYTHQETGIVLAFKCDVVLNSEKILAILDLKTTNDIAEYKFDRDNYSMCRDVQAAAYKQGVEQIFQRPVNAFAWLALETTAPYRFDEIAPDEAMLEGGEARLNHYLREFKERHEANDWSPRKYGKAIRQTSLMAWNWEEINALESN